MSQKISQVLLHAYILNKGKPSDIGNFPVDSGTLLILTDFYK